MSPYEIALLLLVTGQFVAACSRVWYARLSYRYALWRDERRERRMRTTANTPTHRRARWRGW